MKVLNKKETLAAIAAATEPLLKRLAIAEAIIAESGDLIDSNEAMRLTGIKSLVTLRKTFTPTKQGRNYFFSKAEIVRWKYEQTLHKAPELKIAS